MKLKDANQVNSFLAAVNECKDQVYLVSPYGDKFNLKSQLTQYIAIAALVNQAGDDLELFCDNKEDEAIMLKYIIDNDIH
ncbi:MAG: polya polymerase [Lachnospiraceae bacterium]|nr:polya polymerase [Lachnospiraceae bacterium]